LHRLLEHKRDGNIETSVLYDAIGKDRIIRTGILRKQFNN
jgi:hypothetical protein